MKHINLQSVIEAYRNLESSLFQKLMNSYGIIVGGLNGIKDYELDGIEGQQSIGRRSTAISSPPAACLRTMCPPYRWA